MRNFVIAVLLLVVSAASAPAQGKTKSEGGHGVQRCAPMVISSEDHKSPEFHLRKGETYNNSPVVAYEILESGEIAHVILKRSSGIAEVDKYALKWVQGLRFKKRPGCGVLETSADITIDFR